MKKLKSPFDGFEPSDWALEYIARYGGIDGEHHKAWVLDQIARILNGTPVIVKLMEWSSGETEYRFSTGKPSKKYLSFGEEMKGEINPETGDTEYDYDYGVAP